MQHTPAIGSLGLLLDLSVKMTLILALAFLATLLMRRSAAALRQMTWNLAFGSVLMLPLLAVLLPTWRSTWLPSFFLGREYQGTDPLAACAAWVDPSWSRLLALLAEPMPLIEMPFARVLLIVWATVAAILIARNGIQGLWLSLRFEGAERVTEEGLLELLEQSRQMLGLRDRPELVIGAFATPATFGLFRPKVVLPEEALLWSRERQRVVLLHELAHILHRDYPFNLLSQWVCALNWHNPLVWLAAREMRLERECAADDRVISSGERELDYAEHLYEIARISFGRPEPLVAVAMAHTCPLKTRVAQILDPQTRRGRIGSAPLFLLVLMFLLVVAPLAAMQPQSKTLNPLRPAAQTRDCEGEQVDKLRDCERRLQKRNCEKSQR